jgi:molybdenum cofactor cytidylyltransferase
MRPIKAPAEHEPVIPPGTTLLVPLAGIDALDGPLDRVAHRPERIRAITNDELRITNEEKRLMEDGRLTPVGLARVFIHPQGGIKNAPEEARIVPFLNKVETERQLTAAREAATAMLTEPRVARVVVGALQGAVPVREVWRRVTAVILAAGESRRMGRNKLHLPWNVTTVLGQTIANAQASAVSDTLVVTGHDRDKTEATASETGVATTHNVDYAKGMLSSAQTAARHLPSNTEAALIVLGDQPMVTTAIIDKLLVAYAASPRGLVAPTNQGERGNPVLIDRRHFAELLALPPESAPRALLQRHPDDLLLVEVESDTILHDLDRPEEYEQWRPRANAE